MPTDDIVKQIILMPRTFHDRRNISELDLLKEIGYFQEYHKVTEKQIFLKLIQFPECIDEWIQHSEDQRSDQHYLIIKRGLKWSVEFWSSRDKTLNTRKTFFNKVKACSYFIKKYVEHIRKLFS
jgi:hypothetical protein